jgi:hypothetical protein
MTTSDQLEIFFGEASDAEARVYARLSGAEFAGCRITGRLLGPECRFAQTLPATIPFRDRGPGATPLAEATVPDPCFWTPELPFLYRAELEIRFPGSATIEKINRPVGIRRLGCLRQSLYLDAKRWVARGAIRERAAIGDLAAARAAGAVLYVPEADDAFCLEASQLGVPLIVEVPIGSHLKSEISRLARWPAVFIAVLDSSAPVDESVSAAARNLLLAARVDDASAAPLWAKALVCSAQALADCAGQCHPLLDRPIVVLNGQSSADSIAAARAACDILQRDLNVVGDFAGYLC